jgi:hypothetical protein
MVIITVAFDLEINFFRLRDFEIELLLKLYPKAAQPQKCTSTNKLHKDEPAVMLTFHEFTAIEIF